MSPGTPNGDGIVALRLSYHRFESRESPWLHWWFVMIGLEICSLPSGLARMKNRGAHPSGDFLKLVQDQA
jgi:hypothetical protein